MTDTVNIKLRTLKLVLPLFVLLLAQAGLNAQVPDGYMSCAKEGARCQFEGTQEVVYGDGTQSGRYLRRTAANFVDCNVATFGGDPAPNIYKQCFIGYQGSPENSSKWFLCGKENEFCRFTGQRRVMYGAGNQWAVAVGTNGFACSVKEFGDPAPNVVKQCFVSGAIFNAATASAPPSNVPASSTQQLDVDFTNRYSLIWADRGSGAAADVSFWRPEPAAGWFRVGHHIQRGYGNPTEPTMVVRSRSMGALTRPVGYFPVWDDTGSGAKQDGSVWRPACPGSYRAMGDVTSSSHTVPALDEVVCVHETALSAANPGNEIWNDTGSGARRDFAAWDIVSLGPDANFSYATRGLFFADASHNRPAASSVGGLWAIKLPRPPGVAATPITAPPPAQTQGMSRQALEDEFRSCSEARQFGAPTDMSFTASLYWRYLGHGPDGNFQIHSARISHGQVNYAQLEDEFRTCPEAQQHGPSTNLDFVTSLYWRYLGHGPDGNLQMHTNRLVK